jgi:hypothetical protein
MPPLVSSLSSRHLQASEMSLAAQSYFLKMTESIAVRDWHKWESEIKDAESRRLDEPSAMDILGARKAPEDDRTKHHNDHEMHTHTEKWIQMAIDIEEKQYAAILSCPFFL